MEALRRLQSRAGSTQSEARRKDAHDKISLGGLIVKAGLRDADRAFLLGVLMEAAEKHRTDGEYRARMINLGRKGFQS